jgi:flagellar motility protein MotE (MotC chaperone)
MEKEMKKNSYDQFFDKAKELKQKPAPLKVPRATGSSEQQLRAAFKMKKSKPPFPWKAVVGLAISLVAGGFYLSAPETVDAWLNKIEIRTMGQASAADEKPATKTAEKSPSATPDAEKAAAAKPAGDTAKSPGEKSTVNEEMSQFTKLKQRKEELDQREKELGELEEELQRQKVELDKRISQLEEMRKQISQTLKERVEVDQEKVNKLVDLYSNMKPKQAADVIGSLNEELAVEVLAKMKKKNAAEVMNLLPPEKARILSEKYTGYRRISSQEPRG